MSQQAMQTLRAALRRNGFKLRAGQLSDGRLYGVRVVKDEELPAGEWEMVCKPVSELKGDDCG